MSAPRSRRAGLCPRRRPAGPMTLRNSPRRECRKVKWGSWIKNPIQGTLGVGRSVRLPGPMTLRRAGPMSLRTGNNVPAKPDRGGTVNGLAGAVKHSRCVTRLLGLFTRFTVFSDADYSGPILYRRTKLGEDRNTHPVGTLAPFVRRVLLAMASTAIRCAGWRNGSRYG
jgi:hypothetical protein